MIWEYNRWKYVPESTNCITFHIINVCILSVRSERSRIYWVHGWRDCCSLLLLRPHQFELLILHIPLPHPHLSLLIRPAHDGETSHSHCVPPPTSTILTPTSTHVYTLTLSSCLIYSELVFTSLSITNSLQHTVWATAKILSYKWCDMFRFWYGALLHTIYCVAYIQAMFLNFV